MGGRIWNWFDPLTLVRAAAATGASIPNLRIIFPGTTSPSSVVPPMGMEKAARDLSQSLGLTGSRVFFGESWIPYDQRGSAFLEADVGVSLHREDIETRFSFRTRVLDYLWAGLPVLTTTGDSMAELVAREDLGAIVGYDDVDGVAAALTELSRDPERRAGCASRAAAAATRFRWPVVAQPLLDYCDDPVPAADRGIRRDRVTELDQLARDPSVGGPAEVARLARRTAQTVVRDPGQVMAKGKAYVRRRRRPTR